MIRLVSGNYRDLNTPGGGGGGGVGDLAIRAKIGAGTSVNLVC